MKRFTILITLLALASSAFAMTYYLERRVVRGDIVVCYYSGGHILTVPRIERCPNSIQR